MNTIKIEISYFKHQKHQIHIGDCEWLYFKSKTFAKTFIREYKKVLVQNVRILNSYQLQAYILYRTYYFDLDIQTIHRVGESFIDFSNSYNMIFKTYSAGNHNGFMFSRISTTLMILTESVKLLNTFAKKNKHYSLNHSSRALLKMMSDLEQTIENQKRDLNLAEKRPKNKKVNRPIKMSKSA